jgi:hypothetical protein
MLKPPQQPPQKSRFRSEHQNLKPSQPPGSHWIRRETKDSGWRDSNPRPLEPHSSALPSCATARLRQWRIMFHIVSCKEEKLCRERSLIMRDAGQAVREPAGSRMSGRGRPADKRCVGTQLNHARRRSSSPRASRIEDAWSGTIGRQKETSIFSEGVDLL